MDYLKISGLLALIYVSQHPRRLASISAQGPSSATTVDRGTGIAFLQAAKVSWFKHYPRCAECMDYLPTGKKWPLEQGEM